ncbi:MAG: hypothetical protein WC966_01110 [Bradymonadales bacterium]|jgi:hypothetical protein
MNSEETQLMCYDAITTLLSLMVVSTSILQRIAILARENPELDANAEFTEAEIAVLEVIEQENFKPHMMKNTKHGIIAWAVLLIAYLGGYVGATASRGRPPGAIVLARGYQRFKERSAMIQEVFIDRKRFDKLYSRFS